MEENQKIPMRSQVKKEDTWAIEDMYATVEDWEKDFAAAKKVAEEAAEYAGRLGESAQALYDWSALTEKLDCMLSEIYGYASRVKDQDTADAAGQTLSARAMGLYVECSGPGNSEHSGGKAGSILCGKAGAVKVSQKHQGSAQMQGSYFIAGAGKDTGRCRGDGAGARNGLFVFGKCRPDL